LFPTQNKFDCVSLRAFDRYNIPEAVALEGETSFASIAENTGLDEDFVSRIIRFASTNRIFRETKPGWCIHTAASRAMIENRGMRQFLGVMSDEVYEASAKVNAAEDLYHDSGEADETAFQMACNTKEIYWHYLGLPGNESKKQRVCPWLFPSVCSVANNVGSSPRVWVTWLAIPVLVSEKPTLRSLWSMDTTGPVSVMD
jgi:hypothetical protein